jgi:hypothetical protein
MAILDQYTAGPQRMAIVVAGFRVTTGACQRRTALRRRTNVKSEHSSQQSARKQLKQHDLRI